MFQRNGSRAAPPRFFGCIIPGRADVQPGGDSAMTIRPSFYPFRSEQSKAEYEAYYRTREKTWPVPFETMILDTPSGTTLVRASGCATDPPLVLLPGVRASSLMWTCCVAALSAHHRTYALDIMDDVGLSVSRGETMKPEALARWLDEVLAVLVPQGQVSLMGISYGGLVAGHYAVRYPNRLRSVVLVAPGGLVLPISFAFFLRVTLLSIPFPGMSGGPFRRVLSWLFRDAERGDDACRARLEQAITDLKTPLPLFDLPRPDWPTAFEDKVWRDFKPPCLFLVGEHEKIYSAQAAVRRLNRVAPQVKTEIMPGVGHDLTLVEPDLVAARVLEFLGEHEGVPVPVGAAVGN